MLTVRHVLEAEGIDPASVRLLRHQNNRYPGYPTPYVLWRDYPERFDAYQATQGFHSAPHLRAPLWASFVGLPDRSTLFVGLYSATLVGPLPHDRPHPVTGVTECAGSCDLYSTRLLPDLDSYRGRLWIEWGTGYRSWIQRGDGTPKPLVELRRSFAEPPFPGFTNLIVRLSDVEALPMSWHAALANARGAYLLACPKTREQYVGAAYGQGGFLTRWREYAATGHGGNVALKSRDPSDYTISILETVGSSATHEDVLACEARWKGKLLSREMGLNRN